MLTDAVFSKKKEPNFFKRHLEETKAAERSSKLVTLSAVVFSVKILGIVSKQFIYLFHVMLKGAVGTVGRVPLALGVFCRVLSFPLCLIP